MTIFVVLRLVLVIWLFITVLGFLYLTKGFNFNERYNSLYNKPKKDLIEKYGLNKVKGIRNFIYFMFALLILLMIFFQPIMDFFS